MKKVWLMLAAALFCGSAGAAAPELFRPDEALKKKIAADPEMKRILYQAHRTMLSPVMAKVRPDRGDKYTLWYFGTTFTYWMEGLGYSYMVTGDEKYAKKAVELIVSTCRDFPVNDEKLSSGLVCERGQFLYGLAVGCFFFFDKLTPEEQQLVADTAAGYIDETLKEADKPETWWYDIHNHNGVMFGPAGIISLFFQDRPGYKKRVADCVRILKRWINSGFDDKGLPCEGSVYARYSALRVMLFATLLRDQGGEDLFKTTKLKKWPHVYPAKMIPGTNLVETRNDAYYAPPSLECLFVSAANQDPVAEWIWRSWSDRGREYFPLNLLLEARRRPEPALELSKYPLSEFFRQRRLSIWRTGWGGDDAMFSIEAGPYLTAKTRHRSIHAQADRGHFNLYAYGDLWGVDTGYANDANGNPNFSRNNTLAHSCVLIDGKGQGRSGNGPGVSAETLAARDFGTFGYAKVDCTSAYNGNNWGEPAAGAKQAIRDVFFVRPSHGASAYAVVLDNINSDSKTHTCTWQMMLLADKQVELRPNGALIRNGKPFASYATTPARAKNGALTWKVKFDKPTRCSFWGLFRAGGISVLDSDSFYLSIDGGRPMQWNTAAGAEYDWRRIPDQVDLRNSPPKSKMFDFSAGEHTITLSTREREAEVQALFLGTTPDMTPAVPGDGRFLPVAAAEVSGGMVLKLHEKAVSGNRCAVWLDAARPVRMYQDSFTPANYSRPPAVILRLRGDAEAINPLFAAVLAPLKPEMKEPEVKFDRSVAGRVTITVKWPGAVDTIDWNTNGKGTANFRRVPVRTDRE